MPIEHAIVRLVSLLLMVYYVIMILLEVDYKLHHGRTKEA